jgi:hypothetical protein
MRLDAGGLLTRTFSVSLAKEFSCTTMNRLRMISLKWSTRSWCNITEINMRRNGVSWLKYYTKRPEQAVLIRIPSTIITQPSGAKNTSTKRSVAVEERDDEGPLDAAVELQQTWIALNLLRMILWRPSLSLILGVPDVKRPQPLAAMPSSTHHPTYRHQDDNDEQLT